MSGAEPPLPPQLVYSGAVQESTPPIPVAAIVTSQPPPSSLSVAPPPPPLSSLSVSPPRFVTLRRDVAAPPPLPPSPPSSVFSQFVELRSIGPVPSAMPTPGTATAPASTGCSPNPAGSVWAAPPSGVMIVAVVGHSFAAFLTALAVQKELRNRGIVFLYTYQPSLTGGQTPLAPLVTLDLRAREQLRRWGAMPTSDALLKRACISASPATHNFPECLSVPGLESGRVGGGSGGGGSRRHHRASSSSSSRHDRRSRHQRHEHDRSHGHRHHKQQASRGEHSSRVGGEDAPTGWETDPSLELTVDHALWIEELRVLVRASGVRCEEISLSVEHLRRLVEARVLTHVLFVDPVEFLPVPVQEWMMWKRQAVPQHNGVAADPLTLYWMEWVGPPQSRADDEAQPPDGRNLTPFGSPLSVQGQGLYQTHGNVTDADSARDRIWRVRVQLTAKEFERVSRATDAARADSTRDISAVLPERFRSQVFPKMNAESEIQLRRQPFETVGPLVQTQESVIFYLWGDASCHYNMFTTYNGSLLIPFIGMAAHRLGRSPTPSTAELSEFSGLLAQYRDQVANWGRLIQYNLEDPGAYNETWTVLCMSIAATIQQQPGLLGRNFEQRLQYWAQELGLTMRQLTAPPTAATAGNQLTKALCAWLGPSVRASLEARNKDPQAWRQLFEKHPAAGLDFLKWAFKVQPPALSVAAVRRGRPQPSRIVTTQLGEPVSPATSASVSATATPAASTPPPVPASPAATASPPASPSVATPASPSPRQAQLARPFVSSSGRSGPVSAPVYRSSPAASSSPIPESAASSATMSGSTVGLAEPQSAPPTTEVGGARPPTSMRHPSPSATSGSHHRHRQTPAPSSAARKPRTVRVVYRPARR